MSDDVKRAADRLADAAKPAASLSMFASQPSDVSIGLALARAAGIPIAAPVPKPEPAHSTTDERPDPAADPAYRARVQAALLAREEAREKEGNEKQIAKHRRAIEDAARLAFVPMTPKSKKGKRK